MIYVIFWISLFILYFLFFFYWIYTLFKGAPYYPSNNQMIKEIVDFIKKRKNSEVAELGCGDGRVVVALAKAGINVTGVEINPFLSLLTRLKLMLARTKTGKVENKNMFTVNLTKFNMVVAYLFPEIMAPLEEKFYRELKPGAYIISNTFALKKHKPIKIINKKLLIYKI